MNKQQTTVEQLEEWQRLVRWVLWKMATDSVNINFMTRKESEDLFLDSTWVSNVVGEFAAHATQQDAINDRIEFKKALEDI